jgi:hypothetical protein
MNHLVTVAESFSFSRSEDPPTIYTLELPNPRGTSKTKWAPAPNYTRPIPVTASICLDFSHPSAFLELPSRPALILGPARTWHTSIGVTMWEQAKARAEELGSMVLWCDGGKGGISGIGGQGMNEIMRIGPGSWTRTIGIQWPFEESRTVYAWGGDFMALCIFALLTAGGWFAEHIKTYPRWARGRLVGAIQVTHRVFGEWRARRKAARQDSEQGERQLLL